MESLDGGAPVTLTSAIDLPNESVKGMAVLREPTAATFSGTRGPTRAGLLLAPSIMQARTAVILRDKTVGPRVVPIVPAAILFDLGFGGSPKIRPGADCGYKAVEAATTAPVSMGTVGAGAGATGGGGGAATSGRRRFPRRRRRPAPRTPRRP